MGVTTLLAILLAGTILKLRKLSAALLVMQQRQTVKSMVTHIPSFNYQETNDTTTDLNTLLLFEFTWDHAIFVILAVTLLLLLLLGLKYYKLTSTYSLCLELTDGKHSILLDLVLLPQCTDYFHIKVPEEITDLRVAESYFNSKLHSSWSGFGIRNTLTGATIEIDSVISISFWQARSIKHFFVYIYKRHHGLMIPLQ